MSSVTTSRDSVKARLAKQRSGATEPKMANTKRSQPATRSPGTASTKAKSKWSSSTSVNTSVSDTTSSTNVANSTSLSESSSTLDGRSSRLHRPTRKAPLPAVARQSTIKRNLAQRRAAAKKPAVQPDDGWEADMEDAEPADDAPQPDMAVTEVKTTSTYQSSPVTPIPDKRKVAEARKVLQECGVLGDQGTAAHFAALSDADSSLSPPSMSHSHNSPQRLDSGGVLGTEPSMGELRDSISMLQKQVADLRSDVPQVSTNPLREQMEMNRRAVRAVEADSRRSSGFGVPSAPLNGTPSFATGDRATARGQTKKPKKRTECRSRKVPLPADLMAGRSSSGGIAAGQSSALHSGSLSRALGEEAAEGNDSDDSAGSFGLSCGLPGLSHEVADTITHLSAAETIQASVTVTPLSLRDWLLRPVPTPMDPSLTLYGAAVHNAHVACCEVVIGGLLSAIEDGAMERPSGLPCGTYDFRSRGISDQEGLQSVLRALANWMRSLEEDSSKQGTLAPMNSSTGAKSQDGTGGDSVPGGGILQDPRAVPLLHVLRSEALRIIGEEDQEDSTSLRPRAAHLNATDMLHVLTTALVPSFRQLMSRDVEPEVEDKRGVSPESDARGTSQSSSSLFSIPAGAIPEKASEGPEQPQTASAAVEAQVAARIAATGVRPDNPCDPSESESVAIDAVDEPGATTTIAAPAPVHEEPVQREAMGVSPLAALTMMDMRKARESATGDGYDDEGPQGSIGSSSPLSRTGSISADALTEALRKLVIAGAEDGAEGVEEVDVVEMLRQLAAERVAAKKKRLSDAQGLASDSPTDHASCPVDTTSECTGPSSVSESSVPRSNANSEGSESSATAKEKHHRGDKETEQLQAHELEKLLQHPAVMAMIQQMAGGNVPGAIASPDQLHMQQNQAATLAAKERERAMRYERRIAAQQQQQRMMMSTFVNMNMMQNQMANAMFSSMMTHPQQQQKAPDVQKFAMLRSLAKRHGVKELAKMPLKQGASAMMGQSMMPQQSMMSPMPQMSMMAPQMPAQPRMQTPINRFASGITMPYLQVGGQTPLPQNSPASTPAPASSGAVDTSGSPAGPTESRSAPDLPGAPSPLRQASLSPQSSLPLPRTTSGGSGSGNVPRSSSGQARQSSSSRSQQSSSSRSHRGHPMQTQSMMAGYGGVPMMNGMMPQASMMGMQPQKSASFMPGMHGMNGSMMGGSYMGGMGQPGSMNGMMPQKAGSYMGGMGSNSYMGGMGNPMGMPQMGMGGMGNPYGGMQRSSSMPQSQGSQRQRHHSQSGSGQRSSGGSQSGGQRSRNNYSHPAGGMPLAQPQSQGSTQRPHSGPTGYYNGAAAPASLPESMHSNTTGERKSRSSNSGAQQSSSRSAHASRERAHSNGHSPSPGEKYHTAAPILSPPAMPPAHANMAPPPPVHGELLSTMEGSGSFLFDSAGSQQLAAAAAMPPAPPAKAPQRTYKHLGSRTCRWASPQLEVTPEGEDESTMAGGSGDGGKPKKKWR